jgi:tryptophan synthase alpha chain
MSRLEGRFEALAAQGRKALVTYVVAGDPSPEHTVALLHTLVAAGADILELGIPFSDPMSEGPVIQRGHERALAAGMTLRGALSLVAEFRQQDTTTPILLMGYANPVEHMGIARFAREAKAHGVDGLLTVDLPPEEAAEQVALLREQGIDTIFLVAPTTPDARMQHVAKQGGGFIYYVSLRGVTGAGHLDVEEVRARIDAVKSHCALPVVAGFGIKDAETARLIGAVADGIVVGSCLVTLAEGSPETGELLERSAALVRVLRQALDSSLS